jgi:cytochrome c553
MKHCVALLALVMPVSLAIAATTPSFTAGDPAKGQVIVDKVCGACHGTDGNSTSPIYPNLAGQYPEYIVKQLDDFKSGARKNAIMAPNVTDLSHDDILNLAAYFSSQQPKAHLAKDAALLGQGQKVFKGGDPATGVPACAACHGPAGSGIPPNFPRLAGQHAKYVLSQLKNFRGGDRTNDGGKMMQVVAKKMTDQEMKAVADYISGLR